MRSRSSLLKDKRRCSFCNGRIVQRTGKLKDGIGYEYHVCEGCGEEYLDMEQLGAVAERYRKQHRAKVSKWGSALGVRIPKALAEQYKIKANDVVRFIPEKDGLRIIGAQ